MTNKNILWHTIIVHYVKISKIWSHHHEN